MLIEHGTPFSVTASGTAVATASQAGTTSAIYFITDISGSSTTGGTIAVFGGATGTTVLWQETLLGTGTQYGYSRTFVQPLRGQVGAAVSVRTTGVTTSFANMAGFSITAS